MWAISAGIKERKKMFIDVIGRLVGVQVVHFDPGVTEEDGTVIKPPSLFTNEFFCDRSSLSQRIDDDTLKDVRTDGSVDEKHIYTKPSESRDLGIKIFRNFKDDSLFMGYLAF